MYECVGGAFQGNIPGYTGCLSQAVVVLCGDNIKEETKENRIM